MEALGINIIWIAAYLVIFAVMFFAAAKFVKNILAAYDTRMLEIESGLRNAKEAESLKAESLKSAESEKQAILQEAYKKAQDIVENAKRKEADIEVESMAKAQKIIEDAHAELEALRETNKLEGLQDAKEVITLVVRKAFENLQIDRKTEESLIEESLKKIQ